jgi:hypothetical protein
MDAPDRLRPATLGGGPCLISSSAACGRSASQIPHCVTPVRRSSPFWRCFLPLPPWYLFRPLRGSIGARQDSRCPQICASRSGAESCAGAAGTAHRTTCRAISFGLLISVALAVWSGSRGVAALVYAMSRVRHEPERRGFISAALVSIQLCVAGAVFLVVALCDHRGAASAISVANSPRVAASGHTLARPVGVHHLGADGTLPVGSRSSPPALRLHMAGRGVRIAAMDFSWRPVLNLCREITQITRRVLAPYPLQS